MADHESLRNSILQDSDLLGSKRRFGLFSQPISTAVGDDGAFRNKIRIYLLTQILEMNKENR
jgi:hypothetical protein